MPRRVAQPSAGQRSAAQLTGAALHLKQARARARQHQWCTASGAEFGLVTAGGGDHRLPCTIPLTTGSTPVTKGGTPPVHMDTKPAPPSHPPPHPLDQAHEEVLHLGLVHLGRGTCAHLPIQQVPGSAAGGGPELVALLDWCVTPRSMFSPVLGLQLDKSTNRHSSGIHKAINIICWSVEVDCLGARSCHNHTGSKTAPPRHVHLQSECPCQGILQSLRLG